MKQSKFKPSNKQQTAETERNIYNPIPFWSNLTILKSSLWKNIFMANLHLYDHHVQVKPSAVNIRYTTLRVNSTKTSPSQLSHATKYDLSHFFGIKWAICTLQLSLLAYLAIPNCALPGTTVVRYLKGDIFFTILAMKTNSSIYYILQTRKCPVEMKILLISFFSGWI